MKNQTKLTLRKNILFLCLLVSTPTKSNTENSGLDDNLVFDEKMFRGSNVSSRILEHLSTNNSVIPGNYDNIPIIMNGYRVGENDVTVSEVNKKSVICLSKSMLEQAGFINEFIKKFIELEKENSCVLLSDVSLESTVKLNSDLLLDFNVPQSLLKNRDNQSIEESSLNRGENVIFSNYTANYFHNKNTGNHSGNSDYAYLNLNSGLNLGLWQFRQLSSYSYSKNNYRGGSNTSSDWYNISSYLQRPIYSIKSNLIVGKTNTTGQFFGGLSYNGFELSSDESMYPVSEQGYAPTITGIAKTNALIEVRQNNAIIYQTTVPPGTFDIRNINPTSYNGDLEVTVIESDGSKNSFTVPFSAVPDSVRPGKIKYSIASGKTRDLIKDKVFADSSLQYGLNNFITLGGGLRVANDYKSAMVSSVFATRFGAFGINATYSNAHLGGGYGVKQGGMANLTYSKTFQPTKTNISLAGYRYSTEGYREFSDFIYEQYYLKSGEVTNWGSNTYLQKYRLTASIYQPLDRFGSLSFSASTQEYNRGRSRDLYYQVNYNKMLFDKVNMSLSVSRQKTGAYYRNDNIPSSYDTVTMLSFDIPFGRSGTSLSSSIYFDKNNGNQYQTSLSGTLGEQEQPYSYTLNINHNDQGHQTAYSANLNKQYALASINANGSKGTNYTQLGMGMTGAVVLHGGGIVLGPYLGNTFGIVEAEGASGAKIYNGQGASINSSGYALVPSLTPYRYNSVGITSDGLLNNNVDIEASEQKIAPYSGAAIKIKFNTNQGYPLLINLIVKNNIVIPMGATISDDKDKNIGLVGQNNQAYFRSNNNEGVITVTWGDKSDEQCVANYHINSDSINESLIKISAKCI
ncbi:fimbria/pilus outer membrane usher protein [Providencia burhodogranariea]|uniref:Outer membrane usher protein n=1 Tax=Providencia burhodogranariea DSM 19968 TaxID=1141662 RepID=K8X7B0_9GAMM|nr:fimbria/pilus outer membrane usher protein [Providencia burhodogranariea]EKT65562.1 outer membrane usher protein [Providencia burhodogranariea DSM 19968]